MSFGVVDDFGVGESGVSEAGSGSVLEEGIGRCPFLWPKVGIVLLYFVAKLYVTCKQTVTNWGFFGLLLWRWCIVCFCLLSVRV